MILISNKFYDRSKFVARIVLPTFGVLYFLLAGILDLPATKDVLGAVLLAEFGLGWTLWLSARYYGNSDERFDGQIDIQEQEGTQLMQLSFNDVDQLETLAEKAEVRFKIHHLGEKEVS